MPKHPIRSLEKRQGLGYNLYMVISWFGLSSFKISSGPLTVITDPFSKNTGLTPPRGATDIVIISNATSDLYNNRAAVGDEKTFVVDCPGEYDVKSLFIRGVAGKTDHQKIQCFRRREYRGRGPRSAKVTDMSFLRNLQNKPYPEKIRILKFAGIVAAIFIALVWALTLQFPSTGESSEKEKFAPLWENLQKLRNINFSK